MRNSIITFLVVIFVITACNSADKSGNTPVEADSTLNDTGGNVKNENLTIETIGGCYAQIYKRDTSSLQLKVNSDSLNGTLIYKLFEKDRNDGMFKGKLRSDILSGWYYFKSEGIMSVRQVMWKLGNGQLWPAMGEMKIKNDTMIFSQPENLKYDSTHPFVKTNCEQ